MKMTLELKTKWQIKPNFTLYAGERMSVFVSAAYIQHWSDWSLISADDSTERHGDPTREVWFIGGESATRESQSHLFLTSVFASFISTLQLSSVSAVKTVNLLRVALIVQIVSMSGQSVLSKMNFNQAIWYMVPLSAIYVKFERDRPSSRTRDEKNAVS